MPQTAWDQTATGHHGNAVPAPTSLKSAALDRAMQTALDTGLPGSDQGILWADLDPQLAARAEAVARRMLRANNPERSEVRLLQRLCSRHGAGLLLTGGQLDPDLDVDGEAEAISGTLPKLEQVAGLLVRLPGRSKLVRGVAEAVAHPMSNAGRVAEAVAKDRGLAGLILRLVNSPSFGLGAPIATLERALTFVGLAEVQTLALAVEAQRLLYRKETRRELAWKRALACGLAARILARRLLVPAEGLFAAGLLHGLGDGLMARIYPKAWAAARNLAARKGVALDQAQRQVFGYDGSDVGGETLRSWQLAPEAADLVGHQYFPCGSPRPGQAMVLHLAVVLAAVLDLSESGLVPAPVLEQAAWDKADLGARSLFRVADQTLRDRVAFLRVLDR